MQRNVEKRLIEQLFFHLHNRYLANFEFHHASPPISFDDAMKHLYKNIGHEVVLQRGGAKRGIADLTRKPGKEEMYIPYIRRDFLDWGACLRNHPLVPEIGSCLRRRKEHCDGPREASYEKKASFFKHLPRCLGRHGIHLCSSTETAARLLHLICAASKVSLRELTRMLSEREDPIDRADSCLQSLLWRNTATCLLSWCPSL